MLQSSPAPLRSALARTLRAALGLTLLLYATGIALPDSSAAQDWGDPSYDSPSSPPAGDEIGWSLKAGFGFTHDPSTFLMNFELPYAFDRWVSAGPMIQVGVEDDITIVAPTLNVGVRLPDMPGSDFDRFHPYGFAGFGFAVIEDDDERNDQRSAGFLVDFGFGLEYQLSDHVFLNSQMMFNFLPRRTQDEKFFYAWQMAGMRIAF
ncbi:MAG: hypothetical protein CL908_01645 [Deltaproteobacteria bacterium]|nr:hypothetical protein [Deltaproteobacteria bacterium]